MFERCEGKCFVELVRLIVLFHVGLAQFFVGFRLLDFPVGLLHFFVDLPRGVIILFGFVLGGEQNKTT